MTEYIEDRLAVATKILQDGYNSHWACGIQTNNRHRPMDWVIDAANFLGREDDPMNDQSDIRQKDDINNA